MRGFMLAVLLLVQSQGPSPRPPETRRIPAQRGNARNTQAAQLGGGGDRPTLWQSQLSPVSPQGDTQAGGKPAEKKPEPPPDVWARVLGVLTLVCLGFQVWLMFRQTKWMALSARIAAVIERSHLHVDNTGVTSFMVGENPAVLYQIHNEGRIPAQTKEVLNKYFIGATIPETPDYSVADNTVLSAGAVVRPTSHIRQPVRFSAPLTDEQLREVVARNWCVFLWGRITYTDEFGGTSITGFCIKLVFQGGTLWSPEIHGGMPYNYFLRESDARHYGD